MGKYHISVKAIVRDSSDPQSDKLDVKGTKVNLTIWVRFLWRRSLSPDGLRISL
jgi:hypothetical protein